MFTDHRITWCKHLVWSSDLWISSIIIESFRSDYCTEMLQEHDLMLCIVSGGCPQITESPIMKASYVIQWSLNIQHYDREHQIRLLYRNAPGTWSDALYCVWWMLTDHRITHHESILCDPVISEYPVLTEHQIRLLYINAPGTWSDAHYCVWWMFKDHRLTWCKHLVWSSDLWISSIIIESIRSYYCIEMLRAPWGTFKTFKNL